MPDATREAIGPVVTVESVVLDWEDTRARVVFGHRAYLRGHRMFAYLIEGGVAVGGLPVADRAELVAQGVRPVVRGGEEIRGWHVLPVASDDDVDGALDFLRRAWEAVG